MAVVVATCSWWEYTGRYTEFQDSVSSPILRNMTTGEELPSRDLPVGALYDMSRDPHDPTKEWDWPMPKGADGRTIVCKLPDGHIWYIDSRASNCTLPEDNEHRCWVRHGTVGDALTVDKNGKTCAAGAGSIASHGWHGFLENGQLVEK
jgi:hypothetical protein